MASWIEAARERIAGDGAVVRASLVGVKGSAPREAGAMMLITRDDIWQTIGGGTLEFTVMMRARGMLADGTAGPWARTVMRAALGPDMGQCCGGQVRVLLERFGREEDEVLADLASCLNLAHPLDGAAPVADAGNASPGLDRETGSFIAPVTLPGRPAFLYGAGHIGRALAPHLTALQLDLHWVDVEAARFPADIPAGVRQVIASDPTVIAAHAPEDAIHLVITHNHTLDEAICHRVLSGSGFARIGLIGSATKAARFRSRLSKAGIGEAALDRLVCPVGLPDITGKHPARVALSIAAGVAIWQQELDETG
ncbi:MAG: xanthine dehydrogenase accessory protein XdhC [Pseudomonadota bacterium]|nr:xanthine dehydrogenase accessory protein XdhC [Pseudomonadota bacterium]